ncbi:MAG: hypothetical protein ACO25T_10730, partial [Arenimonas sp.]|uniref:hypothetical protein n=1 Tax=Arenimonas sp. TaxID=1872635 RepID=UPI003BFCA310
PYKARDREPPSGCSRQINHLRIGRFNNDLLAILRRQLVADPDLALYAFGFLFHLQLRKSFMKPASCASAGATVARHRVAPSNRDIGLNFLSAVMLNFSVINFATTNPE